MRAAVVCLLAVAGVVLAGVPGKERPHDAPAFRPVMTKTDSGCACKPWSRTMYNASAAVSKLNNECADPEDEGSLWCFTEAPCATPTDTCTPPPQARNYEADGAFSRAGCECADWASSKWNATVSGASCADPDNSGYTWCFVKMPCLAAHQHADAEPWDYCDSNSSTTKRSAKTNQREFWNKIDAFNAQFLGQANGVIDLALKKGRECELKLLSAAEKMNSQMGPTDADREACWNKYHELMGAFEMQLEEHNTKLQKLEDAFHAGTHTRMALEDFEANFIDDAFGSGVALFKGQGSHTGAKMATNKWNMTDDFERLMAVQEIRNAKAIANMENGTALKIKAFNKRCRREHEVDELLSGFNASLAVTSAVDEMPTYRLTMKDCDLGKVKDIANNLQKAIVLGILKASRRAQEGIQGAQKSANGVITSAESIFTTEMASIQKEGMGDEVKQKAAAALQETKTKANCEFAVAKMALIGQMKSESLRLFLESNQTLFRARYEHRNQTVAYRQERIAAGVCDLERPCCGRGKKVDTPHGTVCNCNEAYVGDHCQHLKPDEQEDTDLEKLRNLTRYEKMRMEEESRRRKEALDELYYQGKSNETQSDMDDSTRDRRAEDDDLEEQSKARQDSVQAAKEANKAAIEENQQKKEEMNNEAKALEEKNAADAAQTAAEGRALETGETQICDKAKACCGHGSKTFSLKINSTKCVCNEGFGGSECSYLCDAYPGHADCCGNGIMKSGKCECAEGFSGDDCAIGKVCSGHGIRKQGVCTCSPGWSGAACANKTAVSKEAAKNVELDDAKRLDNAAGEGLAGSKDGNKQSVSASEDDMDKGFAENPTGKANDADKLSTTNSSTEAVDRAIQKQKLVAADRQQEINRQKNESYRDFMTGKADEVNKKMQDNNEATKSNATSTPEAKAKAATAAVEAVKRASNISSNTTVGGNDKIMEMAGNMAQGKSPEGQMTAEQVAKVEKDIANGVDTEVKPVSLSTPVDATNVTRKNRTNTSDGSIP